MTTPAADPWQDINFDSAIERIEAMLPGLMPESRRRVLDALADAMRAHVQGWRDYHQRVRESLDLTTEDDIEADRRIAELAELMSKMLADGLAQVAALRARFGAGDA